MRPLPPVLRPVPLALLWTGVSLQLPSTAWSQGAGPTEAGAAAVAGAVLPLPGESPWLDIPWETDLWEARRKAAAAGKPVFLWEMDGHPLGCT